MLANKGKFGKDNVKTLYTEYTQRTNTTVIPVTRNITNTVKKPRSAFNAHEDTPSLATNPIDQVKSTKMELDMATVVERKYEESKEVEVIDESHTDRDIVKGHTTTNKFEEVEEFDKVSNNTTFEFEEDVEFAKVFYTTTFEFEENEEFDKVFNNTNFEFEENEEDKEFDKVFNMDRDIAKGRCTYEFKEYEYEFNTDKFEQHSDHQEVPCPLLRGGCNQGEFKAFAQQWGLYAGCQGGMDERELRQQLLNCAVGPLENIMYNALGSKLDTLSESDLMEELAKLAVVKSIAVVQAVHYPAMISKENSAKKPTAHRSPAHSGHHVHSQSIPEEKAEDQVLATEVQQVKPTQQDLVAEDLAAQEEAQRVHPAQQEEDLAVHAEAAAGNILINSGGDIIAYSGGGGGTASWPTMGGPPSLTQKRTH